MAFGMTEFIEKIESFLSYLKYEKQYSDDTIKNYKVMYLKGIISKLPWESYLEPTTDDKGYIQNAEQSQQSMWSRMKRNNE